VRIDVGVSENSGFSPQIIHGLIGFSLIFTIHFGRSTIFGNIHVDVYFLLLLGVLVLFFSGVMKWHPSFWGSIKEAANVGTVISGDCQ